MTAAPPSSLLPDGVPGCVVVDLTAIRDNVRALRERVGSAGVMAVVKADGYGHGLVPSARAALAGGAQWLGTAQLDEALALRSAGVPGRILSWLTVPGDRYAAAIEADVDLGVSAAWALAEIAAAARSTGAVARLHVKVDTGLARNGVPVGELPGLLDSALRLEAEGCVALVGAFSHFAWADAPAHPTVTAQSEAFADALALAQRHGARFEVRHLANSAATLTNPQSYYDVVRPGLAVYGLSPVPDLGDPADFGLRPAMTLGGRVALVKRVPVGTGVSYGHAYTTPADTTLALVPLGYADGLPRHAGNAGPVQVRGRTYRVSGRICMDQVVVDLGDAANAAGVSPGDAVVVFGDGGDGGPTAQDWAQAAGTISYEIVTRVGGRLPRRWLGEEAS